MISDKQVRDIIDRADCGAEVCFTGSEKQPLVMGWARHLIEISFKAGIKEGLQMANKIGLNHFIGDFMTGSHHPSCEACKLLKEWGIKEEA